MKKNFEMIFVMIAFVLGVMPLTGCGVDDAKKTVNQAKETVTTTASDAQETVSWWTRSTDHQSWTNPTGTKIEINERRREGDFEVKVTYAKDDLNETETDELTYSGDGVAVIYVDEITEDLINRLRNQ